MAVISNSGLREPGLREIALKIVSVPGFSSSEASLTRALEAWRKALTPEQWHHAAEALICSFLLDVRAEYERNLPVVVRSRTPDPQPPRVGEIRFVEAAAESEPELADEPADEPGEAPAAVLRHSSESENWPAPSAPDKTFVSERLPAPLKRKAPSPSPKFGPVIVSHVSARTPALEPQSVLTAVRPAPTVPTPAPKPVNVQQDGWKVPALRNMKVFPSLANRVTINGVATREGELTKVQIPVRLEQINVQCRASRDKDTHQQARIDRRNELNRQDEAEMRVRRALAQELQAEAERLAAVERVLAERPDGTAITDLDAAVLIECGYERRSE